ncbi:MAG: 3-deoxy-manno-octulosonate cytidylyltransferase [Phycisphaerales bacterium]
MTSPPPSPVAVIPARLGSERFPRKVLASETGRPLIVHVCEAVRCAGSIGRLLVATDAAEVADAVRSAGFEAVMTRAEHANGTSRIAEAVATLGLADDAVVVNVQGDEPEIEPGAIDATVRALAASSAPVATAAVPMHDDTLAANPNIVKVVADRTGHALYFSRAPIPHPRELQGQVTRLRHLGLYVYRAWFLAKIGTLAPTPLEEIEKLEQLRFLEHGFRIALAVTESGGEGIDTPEQYRAFVARYRDAHGG